MTWFSKQTSSFLIALFVTLIAAPAQAASLPLKAGRYNCFTVTVTAHSQTAGELMQETNRQRAGYPIRPMIVPQMLLAPAAFGSIILDGKGGYTMPSTRQSGRYGFNSAAGRPTFTGDLGAMKLGPYNGSGEAFEVGWQGMNFHCGLPAPPSKAIASGTQQPNKEFTSYAGTVRQTASAADFNGHYEGSYVCSGVATALRLDLQARPDGSITGVFEFGGYRIPGDDGYSIGSFVLKGTWSGAHYVLKADHWIKQPQGYTMIDLEGDLTSLGTAGKVLYSSCDSYAVKRS